MISAANSNLNGKLAIDANGLNELSRAAKQNSPEALKAAAKQFESLFMNMVMKSMREASPQDGIFDNQQSKTYTSMLDQQMSQNFANRGVGLADMLFQQLSNNRTGSQSVPPPKEAPSSPAVNLDPSASKSGGVSGGASVYATAVAGGRKPSLHVQAFQERFAASAQEASKTTGIPAKFMLAQAALETGWGKREIKASDGSSSHNLFGIKATGSWKGKVVEVPTTEYVGGVAQTKMQKFRAYDTYAESFRDYAKVLSTNPRYENVIANAGDAAGFAHGLQRAGYATDPNYGAKLTRIIKHSLLA